MSFNGLRRGNETETPKAFTNPQPRVARAAALPWGNVPTNGHKP